MRNNTTREIPYMTSAWVKSRNGWFKVKILEQTGKYEYVAELDGVKYIAVYDTWGEELFINDADEKNIIKEK